MYIIIYIHDLYSSPSSRRHNDFSIHSKLLSIIA